MEIRIGILNSPRELSIESSQKPAEIEAIVTEALGSDASHLKLNDSKGGIYIVPTATLAYVELGAEETRRAGFFA